MKISSIASFLAGRISLLGRISQADRQEAAVLSELDLSSNAVDSSSRGMPRCPPIVTPLEGQRKGYHMEEARAFVAADFVPAPVSAAFQAGKRMNAKVLGSMISIFSVCRN